MMEIIAAVIGAVVGGLFTWLISRKPPSKISYVKQFELDFTLPLQDMHIQYHDVVLESLFMTRYKIRNMGGHILDNPQFVIAPMNKKAEIVSILATFSPERPTTDDESIGTSIENGQIHITPAKFFPFSLNQETLIVDIFTAEKSDMKIAGLGVNQDNTGWTITPDTRDDFVHIDFLDIEIARGAFGYGLFLYVSLILTILGVVGYFVWLILSGLIIVNQHYFQSLLTNVWFWILFSWSLIIFSVSLFFGIRAKWILPLPLPFKRVLFVRLELRKKHD